MHTIQKQQRQSDNLAIAKAKAAPRVGQESPWGEIQSVYVVSPGEIVVISTSSHGGYWVSPSAMNREVKAELLNGEPQSIKLANLPTFLNPTGGIDPYSGWFEEDCDWALVCMAYPEYFPVEALESARNTLKRNGSYCYPLEPHHPETAGCKYTK